MDTVPELLEKKRKLQLEFDESCERFDQLMKDITKWIIIDELNGLFTRQAFENCVAIWLDNRGEREHFSIFKIQLSEVAKKEFSDLLKSSVRSRDIISQSTGNTFLLLTIGTTSADALKIKMRLMQKLEVYPVMIGHASTDLGFISCPELLDEAHKNLAWDLPQI